MLLLLLDKQVVNDNQVYAFYTTWPLVTQQPPQGLLMLSHLTSCLSPVAARVDDLS